MQFPSDDELLPLAHIGLPCDFMGQQIFVAGFQIRLERAAAGLKKGID
jgi:hypothetical protein